jgi:hypothetical protein
MSQPYHRYRRDLREVCSSGIPRREGIAMIDALAVLRRAITTALTLVAVGAVAASAPARPGRRSCRRTRDRRRLDAR